MRELLIGTELIYALPRHPNTRSECDNDRRARKLHRPSPRASIRALFRVVNRYVGNLSPMPGVFPDYPAPVIRNTIEGRELLPLWCSVAFVDIAGEPD